MFWLQLVTVTFDSVTGLVKSVFDITSGTAINLTQNFYWYRGTDQDMPDRQASGAYVFRPDGTTLYNVSTSLMLQKVGNDVNNFLTFIAFCYVVYTSYFVG